MSHLLTEEHLSSLLSDGPLLKDRELGGNRDHTRTAALFVETTNGITGTPPVMALEPRNANGLPVLREYYVAFCVEDPTEYNLAMAVFGDWEHWLRIRNSKGVKPFIESFEREATVKRKALAFGALLTEVREGKNPTVPAKYLIDESYRKDKNTKDGRKKIKETKDLAASDFSEDIARLTEQGHLN